MSGEFVDTNVLVCFAEAGEERYQRSADLLATRPVASVQVLNEFASVARRKLKLDWTVLGEAMLLFRGLLDVRPLTIDTHDLGLHLAERHGFHIYDAMIVSSALLAGCETLYSEDMHDGLLVEGRLRIVNPFAA